MALSKKLRFEVFKRDGFVCQYCGSKPPDIVLEADHINPLSKGGKEEINNLITSCFDCNRGKSNVPLEKIPQSLKDNIDVLKEKELQLNEYNKVIEKIEKRLQKEMLEVGIIFTRCFPDKAFSESFINSSLKKFFKILPKQEILESIALSCSRIDDPEKAIKYFCGICWNKIKAKTDPQYNIMRELNKYWDNQPRGSGYMDERYLKDWISKYPIEKIKQEMDNAKGIWNSLKESLNGQSSN